MAKHKKQRVSWGSQLGFLFAAIGSAIGLGNIWRFSYMTYENGGGAFLIPYVIALLVAGIPLLILEYGLGHKKHGSSSLAFAKIGRKFEFLGWWMPTISTFGIMLFYSVIIGWCVNFFFYSFDLAWGKDTQAFFFNTFLQQSKGVFDIGSIVSPILISVLGVWFVIWLICYKEINHGIEKACLIFMPLLFGMTLFLVGWGLTLPGAIEGIKFYLIPDFSKLLNLKVWMDAFGQIFFTLSLGFGIMIAYASYLPKRTDIIRNAYITSFVNCIYSFIAGFAIFSIVGYMALQKGVPVSQVIKKSITLAFVVFPEGISLLPAFNNLFGMIFFGVLVIAGISSGISLIEAFSAAITDKFNFDRRVVVTSVCVLGFFGSIIFTTSAGLYWLDIADHYLMKYGLVVAGILECVIIGWFLKARVLRNHINAVSTSKITRVWDLLIKYVAPAVLFIILAASFVQEIKEPYGNYSVFSLAVIAALFLGGAALIALLFTLPKWEKEKLKYDHFAEEDKILV